MSKKSEFFIKKYGGDDLHSWAVFLRGTPQPVVTGCSRMEALYHKKELEKLRIRREREQGGSTHRAG